MASPKLRLRTCWVTHSPTGLAVTPERWTRRVSISMKQDEEASKEHRVDGENSQAGTVAAGTRLQARPPLTETVIDRDHGASGPWRPAVASQEEKAAQLSRSAGGAGTNPSR